MESIALENRKRFRVSYLNCRLRIQDTWCKKNIANTTNEMLEQTVGLGFGAFSIGWQIH